MKILKKILLTLSLLSTSLIADDTAYYASSLIGIELGFSNIDSETYNTTATSYNKNTNGVGHGGLKVGAETKSYRVFLNTNYYADSASTYDYIFTYGVQGEYLFNISSKADFFIGLEGGIASMNYKLDTESFSRTVSDTYLGASVGFNIQLHDHMDIEIGGRFLNLNAENINNNIIHKHTIIKSLYLSFIYKYKMD